MYIPDSKIQFIVNDQLFLETLLLEIRAKTLSYSSFKKKEQDKLEKNLIAEIKILEERNNPSLHSLTEKQHEIRKERLRGSLIRSRSKWIDEGEKPTKYFCNLETRNHVSKIIPRLTLDDGSDVTTQTEILTEVERFYKSLYQKNKDEIIDYDLNNVINANIDKLSNSDRDSLERKITVDEAAITLKNMSYNKSPGSDGFTTEFFKMFWKDLGHFVVRSLNYGYESGTLSQTQCQGIITCIPKDGKPKHFMKNWRPITLLNTIYKIASGTLANRIKTVLPKIINSDQTGFIPGRYIGENTRLIYDIMHYTEENNIPGTLLMIDFEKAFDSVSWNFIPKSLQFYNFDPSFQKWILVTQSNSISAVTQAGFLSSFFNLERGCRQGDPILSYIFLLCAEILDTKIRHNDNIKGITINETEHKLTLYADDTTAILDGSEKSLREAVKEINDFYLYSGLKINISKTQITWIGSKKYANERLCADLNLNWTTRFVLLGITYDVDLTKITTLNYDKN